MNGKHPYTSTSSAFDSVHRESIWTIIKAYEIPEKIIRVVKNLYNNFGCAVIDEAGTTDWFKIRTGVKQG